MSAHQPSSPTPEPPAGPGDDNAGSQTAGDGPLPMGEGDGMMVSGAELANLLANGQWSDRGHDVSAGGADVNAYDGHVALALDPGALPDIDSTLDLLTSSHHLFDVPALDASSVTDDASPT